MFKTKNRVFLYSPALIHSLVVCLRFLVTDITGEAAFDNRGLKIKQMKFTLGISLILFVSCNTSDTEYVRRKINDELSYSLTNFSICEINKSGIQFGSDFEEQFVLKLDSNNFAAIVKSIDKIKPIQLIGDSLVQYDRTVGNMEYLSIQLNINQQTLTYTHWSD